MRELELSHGNCNIMKESVKKLYNTKFKLSNETNNAHLTFRNSTDALDGRS